MKFLWTQGMRSERNRTVAFACRADLRGGSAKLEIAATNVYRLHVAGEFAGHGPARAAHGCVRIDRYDLSRFLGCDDVPIVVEVFASNINSYCLADEPPFFGASLLVDAGEIRASHPGGGFTAHPLTDRVQKVQRLSFQRTFAECYRMSFCRSRFLKGDFGVFPEAEVVEVDGNALLERNVPYPTLEDVPFGQAVEQGTVAVDPDLPVWRDRAILEIGEHLGGFRYEELEERLSDEASRFVFVRKEYGPADPRIPAEEYRLFDGGRSRTGFLHLVLTALQDATVHVVWDEVAEESSDGGPRKVDFHRSDCCNVLKYDLKAGRYDLLAFEPTTARFAKVVVQRGDVELERFGMRLFENPEVSRLRFHCSDRDIESIVDAARHTLAQNAVDLLTDCPSRERAGWLCDAYFSGRAEALFTGGNRVERNFLENYALAPQLDALPDGMVPMCYPADHPNGVYIPNWAMWYVLEIEAYVRRTGDTAILEASRGKVQGILSFFRGFENEDGLLEDLESWVFIEWSRANDPDFIRGVNYPTNMLYAAMLDAAESMHGIPGLASKAEGIRASVRSQSFQDGFFEDNRVRGGTPPARGPLLRTGNTSETCQYYAFYFGVATPESHPELFERMVREFGPGRDDRIVHPTVHRSNAIVGNYLRLELLLRYGQGRRALEECRAFFAGMARETGTLWEHAYRSCSLNHGFASVAAQYILECVSGYIGSDGRSKRIRLREPDVSLDLDLELPVGDASVRIRIEGGRRDVTLPEGFRIEREDAC